MKAGDSDKLGEVIRRYNSMRVEDYQRTYSWTNDAVDDFFVLNFTSHYVVLFVFNVSGYVV